MSPTDITIAITVYSRRDFLADAIRSALDQTFKARVMVVEDCGPDPTLRGFVEREFGSTVKYIRNARNRGLFDNWNACIEACETPWLSILHDDDMLRPNFVQSMVQLSEAAPGRCLYFGRASKLVGTEIIPLPPSGWKNGWRDIDLSELSQSCFLLFPGQLFRVDAAHAVGGVRKQSYFTGDWDLWFRLALHGGASQTEEEISVMRSHEGTDRGTTRVERNGWKWALDNIQRKRNLALLKQSGIPAERFSRFAPLAESPIPSVLLMRHARRFTRRMLHYNHTLFLHSRPPHLPYALLQWVACVIGPGLWAATSHRWQIVSRVPHRSVH